MLELPDEILLRIGSFLNKQDLGSWRSSCRRLNSSLSSLLFERINLRADETNRSKFNILNASYREVVRRLHINASCLPARIWDNVDTATPAHHGHIIWKTSQFAQLCIRHLGGLSKLSELSLEFVAAPKSSRTLPPDNGETDLLPYRSVVLRTVAEGLLQSKTGYDKSPAMSLAIENLHNCEHGEVTKSPDFQTLVKSLGQLHLRVTVEERMRFDLFGEDDGPPGERWPGVHYTLTWIKRDFFLPCYSNLTHVSLGMSVPWGFFPVFSVNDLFFPKLRTLALYNLAMASRRALNWILMHQSTLSELYLEACSIIVDVQSAIDLSKAPEAFDSNDLHVDEGEDWKMYSYKDRWALYFDEMQTKLPKLRKMAFGAGPIKSRIAGKEEHVSKFSDRYNLQNHLCRCIYSTMNVHDIGHVVVGFSPYVPEKERDLDRFRFSSLQDVISARY